MTPSLLDAPRHIWRDFLTGHDPTFTVAAISGGNDSLAAYHAAKALGIAFDAILHVNTRTGIPQVADFVRNLAQTEGVPYVEADAGTAYEDYVLRKGFFGRGETAHRYAYHVLKAGPLRSALSKHFRQGKRGVTIALINGARREESTRRTRTKSEPINADSQPNNIWVSLIHDWTRDDRDAFLASVPNLERNPVAQTLCRSGECFCGTMQSRGSFEEAAFYYPEWGARMRELEARVLAEGFTWRWGENVNDVKAQLDDGAQLLFDPPFMCVGCVAEAGGAS